jgi:hypothetical protein
MGRFVSIIESELGCLYPITSVEAVTAGVLDDTVSL